MKRSTAILLVVALLGSACVLSSCSRKEKTVAGVVLGGAVGAGIGSAAGGTGGAVAGGAIGAVTGGLIGHSTGDSKKKDKK
jgi:uncharacterized membrane protein